MTIKTKRNTLITLTVGVTILNIYLHSDVSLQIDLTSIKNKITSIIPGSQNLIEPPSAKLPNSESFKKRSNIPREKSKILSDVVNRSLEGVFAVEANGQIGSGWAIAQNLAVSNKHVVGRIKTVRLVNFGNSQQCTGEVIHTASSNDIAFIKHNCPCKTLELSGFEKGQLVVSIGNPFGLGINISVGEVLEQLESSISKSRNSSSTNVLRNVIIHNSLLNPGNSGGPLLNEHGKVIGMNTAVSKSKMGIAIPVIQVEDELKNINK